MDPLSISASIAGLITLTEIVLSHGYEFAKGVKHAKDEIRALLVELTALFGVLQTLRLTAARFESERSQFSLHVLHLESCHDLVTKIRDDLKKALPEDSDGYWRAAGKSLRWPRSSSEIKALIQDVERHKATLSIALEVDGFDALLNTLGAQQRLERNQKAVITTLNQLRETIDQSRCRNEASVTQKERMEVLGKWTTINPDIQHASAHRLHHHGTSKWFLEGKSFSDFLEGSVPALWLCGFAGVGKTVLTSAIIETLKSRVAHNESQGLAYIYCDHKDFATQNITNILRSLVKHAATQNKDSFEDLKDFTKDFQSQSSLSPVPTISQIQNLFSNIATRFEYLFVAIDALDEIPDTHRHEALKVLCEIQAIPSVRLICTSREEVDIANKLAKLNKVQILADVKDLEIFVASEIEVRTADGRLSITHTEVKEEILDKLSHHADGMFRWAACQLDNLCELSSDKAKRRALNKLPRNLSETYERVLERIRSRGEDAQHIVRRVLQWTMTSVVPLTIDQLVEAIAVEDSEEYLDEYAKVAPKDILRWCSCLVRVTPDAQKIELAHFTVEEFLKSIDPLASPQLAFFARLDESANLTLARTCLKHLTFDDANGQEIISSLWKNECCFWTYAATYWPTHVLNARNRNSTMGLLYSFFNPTTTTQFANWNRFKFFKDCAGMHLFSKTGDQSQLASKLQEADSISPLHRAANFGLSNITQWLLSSGLDVNTSSVLGIPLEYALMFKRSIHQLGTHSTPDLREPLVHTRYEHTAYDLDSYAIETAVEGISETLKILIDANSMINFTCTHFRYTSPLGMALESGDPSLVKILLEAGANVDLEVLRVFDAQGLRFEDSSSWESVLQIQKLRKILHIFLKFITDMDIQLNEDIKARLATLTPRLRLAEQQSDSIKRSLDVSDDNNMNTERDLFHAARTGQIATVTRLINLVASVSSYRDEQKYTPLHVASSNNHYDAVSLLLKHNADTNAQDINGNTPTHLCLNNYCDMSIFKNLLQNTGGKIVSDFGGNNVMHRAVLLNHPEAIRYIADNDPAGVYRKTHNCSGETPLALASLDGNTFDSEIFAIIGDPLSLQECRIGNIKGETCLHYATLFNNEIAIQYLLQRGLLDERTLYGSTALHYAAGFAEVYNMKPSYPGPGVSTTTDRSSVLRILLRAGADVMLCGRDNMNVWHLAAFSGSEVIWTVLCLECNQMPLEGRTSFGDTPLLCAIQSGNTRVVANLIEKGVDTRVRDLDGNTLLHAATTKGNIELLDIILQKVPHLDVEATNLHGQTPILLAAARRKWNSCFRLAAVGVRTGCADSNGYQLLHCVVNDEDALLSVEDKLFSKELPLLEARNVNGDTPLLIAGYNRFAAVVERLIDMGADVEAANNQGLSLFMHAACVGSIAIVRLLLQRGCVKDIDAENSLNGRIALNYAASEGHVHIVRTLLEHDADISRTDKKGYNVVHLTVDNAQIVVLREVLEFARSSGKALDIEAKTKEGFTALILAQYELANEAEEDQLSLVETLLRYGADPSNTDIYGRNAIHGAAKWKRRTALEAMLESIKARGNELDVHIRDTRGVTALMLAPTSIKIKEKDEYEDDEDQLLITQTLLEHGAYPSAACDKGWNAIHYAVSRNRRSALEMMLKLSRPNGYKLDVNAKTICSGRTALMIAQESDYYEDNEDRLIVIKTILKYGANPSIADWKGCNSIYYAAKRGRGSALEMMLKSARLNGHNLNIDAKTKRGYTALMRAKLHAKDEDSAGGCMKILEEAGATDLDLPLPRVSDLGPPLRDWQMSGGLCIAG